MLYESVSKEQLQEYLDNEGSHCPICKSERFISVPRSNDDTYMESYRVGHCLECNSKWRSIYSLVGIDNIETEIPNSIDFIKKVRI